MTDHPLTETARQVAGHLLHCADRIDSTTYRAEEGK